MQDYHVITIGASAGGIKALKTLVKLLPQDFPAPILIAQHISEQADSRLALISEY